VGEALVSTLQAKGIPAPVQRVLVRPPQSRMGKATVAERKAVLDRDPNMRLYGTTVDRRSAHEILSERTEAALQQANEAELAKRAEKAQGKKPRRSSNRQSVGEAFLKSAARSLGSAAGRQFFRGILGSLLK
jgi:hypothetical protein